MEGHDCRDGAVTTVLYVLKSNAKVVKTILEREQLLDKRFRLTHPIIEPTSEIGNDDSVVFQNENVKGGETVEDDADQNVNNVFVGLSRHFMAVPVVKMMDQFDDFDWKTTTSMTHESLPRQQQQQQPKRQSDNDDDWKQLVHGKGMQWCSFSSSFLGNQNRHRRHKNPTVSLLSRSQKYHYHNDFHHLTTVQQALVETIVRFHENYHTRTEAEDGQNMYAEDVIQVVSQLCPPICPKYLEVMGDDRTLVIPYHAFDMKIQTNQPNDNDDDENYHHHRSILGDLVMRNIQTTTTPANISTTNTVDETSRISSSSSTTSWQETFYLELWKQLAYFHDSQRVVQRGIINPNSRIRQSNTSILWTQHPISASKGPGSPGWITVTENGIRQSFDLTRVMFSRGNITEKIRWGQRLVQPGEVVLDLYAGIGYYTLPAILHGQASCVYACEWNDDAVEYLLYNLQDNGIHDDNRVVVLRGDCRTWMTDENNVLSSPSESSNKHNNNGAERKNHPQQHKENQQQRQQSSTPLINKFDRVILGLLPSSEGGWRTAIRALNRSTGGWLHIHGNVLDKEVDHWAKWVCVSLLTLCHENYDTHTYHHVVVFCHHVERVKSFAPTVSHYVADVFVGPAERLSYHYEFDLIHDQLPLHGKALLLQKDGSLLTCPNQVMPPSCALSPDGPLHQEWLREITDNRA